MTAAFDQQAARRSLWQSDFVILGLPLLGAIVAADAYALRAQRGDATNWQVYGAYALFVGQTALLSAMTGTRVSTNRAWWGILAWGIVLVDLQLFAIAAPDTWSTANTVGFAFASAQFAALLCFGVLGDSAWQIRFAITFAGTGLALFFALSLNARDAWYLVLIIQCLGAAAVCLVMRRFGFRIERRAQAESKDESGSYAQFSIRHLFYWTTAVAILVAFGRLINWQSLLGTAGQRDELLAIMLFGPTLTLVSILSLWAALGREPWFARLVVALIGLPATGALLGAFSVWSYHRGRWGILFPHAWETRATLETGIAWTFLAGGMLAGLLLVLRTSGHRMVRRINTVAAN